MPDIPQLLASLACASREHPFARKLLICSHPAEGRELLRALSLQGLPWAGWEVVTLRQLAHDAVALELASRGIGIADEFDILSVVDEAIDTVVERGAAGPFGGATGAAGYRDALGRSIEALRVAGLAPGEVASARVGDSKLSALAAVLHEYQAGLERRGRVDVAGVLLASLAALASGRASLPDGRYFLLPGLPLQGAAGALVRLLPRDPRTVVLPTDSVPGLTPPPSLLWEAPGEPSGPLSALYRSSASAPEATVHLFAAATPVDELREVLRRVTNRGIPWDQVEIVTTDPITYGAALDGLARRLGIPVSYSMGVDVRRTRVGRAVSGWFRWVEEGFPADVLRGLLESGDLLPPAEADGVSGAMLARRLRRLRIGWGWGRYLPRVEAALRALPPGGERIDAGEETAASPVREERELRALHALLERILSATPAIPDRTRLQPFRTSPAALARGLLAFLELVPVDGEVDGIVRAVMQQRLERARETLTRATGWEAALSILRRRLDTRVAPASEAGPSPWTSSGGCLHLSGLSTGGLACRPHTFVVGLDAARASGMGGADPLLTDADRIRLNGSRRTDRGRAGSPLPTTAEQVAEARFRLAALLARLRGEITLSFSAWDAAEGRAVSPAAELLQALRLRERNDSLTYEDLREALGPLSCAVPREERLLDASDVWLASIASGGVLRAGTPVVRDAYPRLDAGLRAQEARARTELTEYHGRVTPRPELDPLRHREEALSASRLETLGTCPRRYFYRFVLGVTPTRDPERDLDSWLDAAERGNLLHRVFERTLAEARRRAIAPDDFEFETLAAEALLAEAERTAAQHPPPGAAVMHAELAHLREDVLAWVEMLRRDPPAWLHLELRFGPGEREVVIQTSAGPLPVRGAIDRVDQIAPGRLRIVDYKTGRADRYRPSQPYRGGRRLQHVIYVQAAQQLLDGEVEVMEYHFPTRAGQLAVVPYRAESLHRGIEVLESLFSIASDGHFVPTDDPLDCKHCDFAPVCRAQVDDFGNPRSPAATWAREHGSKLPEYERLTQLRMLDG